MKIQRDLKNKIKSLQELDDFVRKIRDQINQHRTWDFVITEKGLLKFWDRIYIPQKVGVREEILEEAHKSKYTIHPRAIKMYQDSKKNF